MKTEKYYKYKMIHYYYIISQKKLSCYKPSPGCRQRRAGSTWHVDRLSESPARSTPFPRATRRRGCSCCEWSPGRGVPGLFRARARSCSGPGRRTARTPAPRRSGTGRLRQGGVEQARRTAEQPAAALPAPTLPAHQKQGKGSTLTAQGR
jgi:hypothetical protein